MSLRSARALTSIAALTLAAACGVVHTAPNHSNSLADRHLKTFQQYDVENQTPGHPGEVQALEYARAYFASLGLKTFLQPVHLVQMIPTTSKVTLHGPNGMSVPVDASGENFVLWSGDQSEHITLDAGLMFAGYGIVSPEFQRDDYKDVDVKNKIVVLLEGSPMTGERNDLGTLGDTYYGTAAYKFTEAAKHGAAGVLIVPTLDSEWAAIRLGTNGSVIELDRRDEFGHRDPAPKIQGWLSRPAAARLFGVAGLDFDKQTIQAHELAFAPVPLLGHDVTVELDSRIARFATNNVVAVLPGESSEYVMLAGRWNRVPHSEMHAAHGPLTGDDGSSAAAVLETARQLSVEHPRPLRSVVFLVATALEPGVLGLERYTEAPPTDLPLEQMTALVMLDHADLTGTSRRVGKIGLVDDEALAQLARGAAADQGRLMELDEDPERSFYYAEAETEFGREGVRALYLSVRTTPDARDIRVKNLVRRDKALGLGAAPQAAPWQDPEFLTNLINRAANATNWPARLEPLGNH